MKYWETASQEDLQRIHEGACQVLEEIGMRIKHKETVDILVGAGAKRIDDETVKIPRALVERSIERAPATFRFYDRRGGFLEIGGEHHHHIPGATMTEVLEYPSRALRPATLEDYRNLPRIIDALEFVDIAVQPVEAMDAPPGMAEVLACAELLKNTSKYCWACPAKFEANQAFVDMAKAIAGTQDLSQRPIIGLLATIIPVYEIDSEACKVLLLAAREGLPVCLMGNAIGGMQGPATNAGCVVMEAAEELAGLCVVQTVRPGSPLLADLGRLQDRYAHGGDRSCRYRVLDRFERGGATLAPVRNSFLFLPGHRCQARRFPGRLRDDAKRCSWRCFPGST